jgi:hypothetical protein
VPAASEIVLQCTEVWAAVLIRANDLAVQDELGGRKARQAGDDGRETARPVKSTAGIKPHATVLYVGLHPIAIQLEFMHQATCSRDLVPGQGEARLDKSGKRRQLAPGSARASERDECRREDATRDIENSSLAHRPDRQCRERAPTRQDLTVVHQDPTQGAAERHLQAWPVHR